jgi:hypothetical protein
MALNAKITEIDDFADLLLVGGNPAIRWGGFIYGPFSKLEDVASGDLLIQCKKLLSSGDTKWREIEVRVSVNRNGSIEISPFNTNSPATSLRLPHVLSGAGKSLAC